MKERVCGHLVNFMMLHRPGLSALRHVYTFAERHRDRDFHPFSRSLHHELGVLQGLIFAVVDKEIDQEYLEAVFCGDSSSVGYALKVTSSSADEVRRAAHYRERWRFDLECGPPESDETSHRVVGSSLVAPEGELYDAWGAALRQRLRPPDLSAPKWCRPGHEVPRVGSVPVLVGAP